MTLKASFTIAIFLIAQAMVFEGKVGGDFPKD
jgi:hypothetical protein